MTYQNQGIDLIILSFFSYVNKMQSERTEVIRDLLLKNKEGDVEILSLQDRAKELERLLAQMEKEFQEAKALLEGVVEQKDLEVDVLIAEIKNLKDLLKENGTEITRLEGIIERRDVEIKISDSIYEELKQCIISDKNAEMEGLKYEMEQLRIEKYMLQNTIDEKNIEIENLGVYWG